MVCERVVGCGQDVRYLVAGIATIYSLLFSIQLSHIEPGYGYSGF